MTKEIVMQNFDILYKKYGKASIGFFPKTKEWVNLEFNKKKGYNSCLIQFINNENNNKSVINSAFNPEVVGEKITIFTKKNSKFSKLECQFDSSFSVILL